MKRIDPKKLLPSSVPAGGSFGSVSPNILVPVSNITAKTYAKVEPEENTPQKSQLRAQTFQIKSKLIEVSKLFSVKNKFTRDKNRKKRIEEERERREQREKESERTTFNFGAGLPKLVLPRTGFLDSIKRFLLYSLLGFAVEKFLPLVPKLLEFGKMLIPAVQFLSDFAGNFLVNMVNFIDRGYKVYDGIKEQLDRIIPPDISKQFSEFSGILNAALNTALFLGTAAIGLGGPLGKLGIGARELGTGIAGAAAAAGYASRYTFRTVKDTAPILSSRLSNMMLRTSMGLPAAKVLPTKKALRIPEFALQYKAQKPSYTSAKDKAIAESIVEGALDSTNQALRKRGMGVIDDAAGRNVARNVLRSIGFGNTVGPNEPLRPLKKSIDVEKIFSTYNQPSLFGLGKRFKKKLREDADAKFLESLDKDPNLRAGAEQQAAIDIKKQRDVDLDKYLKNILNLSDEEIDKQFKRPETSRQLEFDLEKPKTPAGRRKNILARLLGGPGEQDLLDTLNKGTFDSVSKPKVTRVSPTQEVAKGISKFKFGGLRKAGPGIFGALLDIGISLALGEPLDRAVVSAIGAGLGGWLGGVAGSIVPGLGTIIGGTLGSMLGGVITLSLYDTIFKKRPRGDIMRRPPEDPKEKLKRQIKLERLEGGGTYDAYGTVSAPYVPFGSYYSIQDLVRLALSVGFKKENAAIAAAIAMAESSGNPNNHNEKYPDNSYGLWQINMLDEPGYMLGEERRRKFNIKDNNELFNPTLNAQIAYKLSGGYNFNAWTTYTNGRYRTFLRAAQEALQKTSTTPVIPKPQSSLPPLPPTNTVHGQHYGASRSGGRQHAGVDFDISGDEVFYSRIGGQVIGIYNDPGGYGNYVDIYNKDLNVTERIAEGAVVLVSLGDVIQPGTPVVRGETGTGVIHYEIRRGKSGSGGSFSGTLNPIDFLNNLPKQRASISKPSTTNIAKGLDEKTSYEDDNVEIALLPIKEIIEKPVPIGGSGGGTFIDTTNSSNIFAPALIG